MTTTLLPKQRLKDYCRRKQYSPPVYILTDEEKIDLHKQYTIQVTVNRLVTAEGRGLSRRIAEFKAAMHAITLIGQSDPSVFDNHGTHKFGRSGIGRSFSVDHISRSQRTDSIPSMMSLAMGTGQFSSAAPSIDGIDSLTENGDSLYGSEIANGFDGRKEDYQTVTKANLNGVEEEETLSDSIDEGVYVESSESSSPPVSSPTSSAASRAASVVEQESVSKVNHQVAHQSTNQVTGSSQSEASSKSKAKSKSSSFLSSFFLLSSLRAISRRSLRRKPSSAKNSSTKAEFSFEDSTPSQAQSQSRPTSSSSSASYSSTSSSSAFSSNSSISSSQQSSSTSSNSSTSGSFTLPDDSKVETDGPVLNGYSNLITESIIEEEEEEEEEKESGLNGDKPRKESCESSHSAKVCNGHTHTADKFGASKTMPRSVSSSYVLSSMCPHNHFSIYGPVLCSNALAQKNQTIEATPSAALLRYCVRMYLPLPYYDIRFDNKFYVTCRVILTPSKSDKEKLLVTLPEQYKNYEFTARGNGETLRSARNMAAQTIIEKLKKASIYHE